MGTALVQNRIKQVLPTGMVTFLFTDIEGSTRRWEEYPRFMEVALPRHDAVLREAIERHSGYVFKTMGDAFCAAFSDPDEALLAILEANRALQVVNWRGVWRASGEEADVEHVEPLRVRAGLHTGEAQERDGDYFGP